MVINRKSEARNRAFRFLTRKRIDLPGPSYCLLSARPVNANSISIVPRATSTHRDGKPAKNLSVDSNHYLSSQPLKFARFEDVRPYPDDWLLVQRCVAGDCGAQKRLRAVLDQFVRGCLLSRGASHTEADDIVADISSESLARSETDVCLLGQYQGKCLLKNWLARVATNRWIDFKRREAFLVQLSFAEDEVSASPVERIASQEAGNVEVFLLTILRNCLQSALVSCTAEELLMMRLVYLEDVFQSEIGKMWGWHGSKVSRRLRETMRRIESRTLSRLNAIDPWLTISWDDILKMSDLSTVQFL
jgi:RNA polymerase sigma factor (sigma-70 family)